MATTTDKQWNDETLYQQYLEDVRRYPLLDRPTERALLAKSATGDLRARNELVKANLRFVVNIAFMYKGQGLPLMDLINEGNAGLIKAAERFEPGRNLKFISYAVWWIRQSITGALAEKARLVRISAEKELVLRQLNRKATRTRQTIGGEFLLDDQEMANKSDYNPEQVNTIMQMGLRHVSLDAPAGDDGDTSLLEVTQDPSKPVDKVADAVSRTELLSSAIAKLDETEQEILGFYFGVGKGFTLTLQEIGRIYGMSKERVRQIKEGAVKKLREMGLEELALAA